MWWSWSKFAFIECEFQLPNSFKCKFKCRFNGPKQVSASFVASNNPKMQTVHYTEYVECWITLKYLIPSVLWRCWLGGRKGTRPVKTEWWGTGMLICLERGAYCPVNATATPSLAFVFYRPDALPATQSTQIIHIIYKPMWIYWSKR